MAENVSPRHRRTIRLAGYDYRREGAYFITICTQGRTPLFGRIVEESMHLNVWGGIVVEEWERTALLRPNVELDAFIVMPNHVHGIIVIVDSLSPSNAGRGAMHCAPTDENDPLDP